MSTEANELSKDEIIKKWIYHAPGLSLPEAVDKCMSEYAAQEVAKERDKAKQTIEHCSELMSMQTAEIERLNGLFKSMVTAGAIDQHTKDFAWQNFKKENNL